MKPVVMYVRVSTEEQAASGLSLAMQVARCTAYAELYGLAVVAIVRDPGESAKTLARPGLSLALDIARRDTAGVLVYKLDRLTRSVRDLGTLLEGELASRTLYSVCEQIDTHSPAGRLVLNILISVAQWEREEISARTKAALSAKKRTPKHETAAASARAMRARGLTLRQISRSLAHMGTVTKAGRPLSCTQVSRLLLPK